MTILSNTEQGVFRLGTIQTLGVLKDPRATALLTDQLDDTSVQVRRIATEALGEIGDRGAIAPLLKMLNDQSAEVRWAAADALGSIGDASVADSLIAIIGKGRIWARRMVRVLDRLDANWREREATLQIETYFLEHIDHPEPEVQWRSAEALGEIATAEGEPETPASPGTETHPYYSSRARLLHPKRDVRSRSPARPGPASVWHRGNGTNISKCRPPRARQSRTHLGAQAGNDIAIFSRTG